MRAQRLEVADGRLLVVVAVDEGVVDRLLLGGNSGECVGEASGDHLATAQPELPKVCRRPLRQRRSALARHEGGAVVVIQC